MNHLAYFPLPIRIFLLVLALAIFVPRINLTLQNVINSVSHLAKQVKKPMVFLLTCAISVSLFWLFRTKTHFLGDGYTWISYLESNAPLIKWSEPLDILLHLYSYRLLNLLFEVSAESIYTILSCLSGVAFISVLFFFSGKLGKTSFERLLIFSLLMFLGGSQLFFGYAEHYSWVYVAVFSYLVFSLRFLEGEVSILAPFLAFLACAGFHFSAFYLFPSLIFLFALGLRMKRVGRWKIALLSAALLAATAFQLSKGGGRLADIFVPLFQARSYAPGYTLLSPSHILDMINEHLLLSPFGFIVLLSLFLFAGRIIKLKDKIILFLVIVSISQLAYNFLIDPKFGAPRDWDLFSATALGYSILAVYLLTKHSKAIFNFRYTVLVLISVSLFSTLPWILVNASADRSIQRFRTVLDLDPERSRTGHYILAQYFAEHGMAEEVEKEAQKERELFPEATLLKSGGALIEAGKPDEAEVLFKQAIQKNPYYADAYFGLGRAYTNMGLYERAIKEINKAIELNPYRAAYPEGLGLVYFAMGQFEEAIRQYKKAAALGPEEPAMHSYRLGAAYEEKGSLDEAALCYKKSVELEPEFVHAWYALGTVYGKMEKWNEAIRSFEEALQVRPDYAPAHHGLGRALALQGSTRRAALHLQQYLDLSEDTTGRAEVEKLLQLLKKQ